MYKYIFDIDAVDSVKSQSTVEKEVKKLFQFDVAS